MDNAKSGGELQDNFLFFLSLKRFISMNPALILFVFFTSITVIFQLALAIGIPWGNLAMGGKYPGKFPTPIRIAAVFQIMILLFFIWIAFVKAGVFSPDWKLFSDKLIWVVFGFSVVATVLNIITPSKWERIIWAPVSFILLITSLILAMN